jgi:hypothetical protein
VIGGAAWKRAGEGGWQRRRGMGEGEMGRKWRMAMVQWGWVECGGTRGGGAFARYPLRRHLVADVPHRPSWLLGMLASACAALHIHAMYLECTGGQASSLMLAGTFCAPYPLPTTLYPSGGESSPRIGLLSAVKKGCTYCLLSASREQKVTQGREAAVGAKPAAAQTTATCDPLRRGEEGW